VQPVVRVRFNSEFRCEDPSGAAGCNNTGQYPDTPLDNQCLASGSCNKNSPTFWSARRLSSIQTQVYENGVWRTVSLYDLAQSFPDPGGNSEKKLWLDSITRRPGGDFNWSAFEQMEAEYYDAMSGVEIGKVSDYGGGEYAKRIHDGDWLKFDNVDFGAGADKLILRIATKRNSGSVKVRLDSPTGQVIATYNVSSTGGWDAWKSREVTLSTSVSGVKTIYVTFDYNSTSTLLRLNWLRFTPSNPLPGLPAVQYEPVMLKNRWSDVATYPMYMPRLKKIITELGGEVEFNYGQSHPCPANIGPPYIRDPYDCFPDRLSSGGIDLWNKWKVLSMTLSDPVTSQPTQTYTYTYSAPTYAYNDEIYDPNGYFWNDFRGHKIVTVSDSSGAKTEYRFYRGMEGDKKNANGGVHHENITLSDGSTRTDYNWLSGMTAEVRRLKADDTALTRTVTWYEWQQTLDSSNEDREDPHWVDVDKVEETVYGSQTKTTRTEYDYDNYGNVTYERQMGDVSDAADNRTMQYEYVYNTAAYMVDRVKAERLWAGDVSASAPGTPGQEKALTEYAYDGQAIGAAPTQGNLTLTRAYSSISPDVYHDSTAGYDALGRVTSATDANGNATTTSYDPTYGYVSQVTNALGHTVSTVADPATHKPKQITDANGHVTTLAYDEYHRLTQVWLPTEPTSGPASFTFEYHPEARPAWVKSSQLQDASSSLYLESWAYVDGFGRSVQTQTPSVNAGQRIITQTDYNNTGQVLRSSSAYEFSGNAGDDWLPPVWNGIANYQQFEYDELGNQTKVETRSHGNILFSSQTQYDAWRTAFTDANGHQTERFVDAFGRLRQVIEHNNTGNYTTYYDYDLAGNLTQVTDAAGNITTLSYDLLGRKTSMTDPDMGTWTYQYDGVGNLTAQQDGRGLWLYMSYDALNRLTAKRKDSAAGPLLAEYFYDAAGYKGLLEKSKAYTAEGVVEVRALSYDARNRLTQQEWVIPGAGGGTFRMSYSYNAADQRTTVTYPGGNNGQIGEQVSYGYNSVGQLTAVSGNGVQYLSAAAYNPLGQATELRLDAGSNGLWRNFDYNAGTSRLETLRAGKNANHDDIQKLSFTYDNVGNVLSITDALNANQTQTFGYDWLNRLTSAATNAAGTGQYNHSYSYDAIGNITVKDGQSYTYGSGKPHAVTAAQGNSYGYDGNGNMITRVIAGVTYTLSYDYENRLIEVKQDATVVATFLYDADGNRVKGTVSGATTVYIAGVYEWQSGASTSYYEGPTGIIALRRAGHASDNGVKYLLSDHLGSTGVLVNQDGSVAARNYYHPYGDNRDGPFSALTTKRFTGQYHEAALGLYFYNARWYDPALGRFTQADTLIPSPANPQAFNRYAYTLNNPVRYTDPSGHRLCETATERIPTRRQKENGLEMVAGMVGAIPVAANVIRFSSIRDDLASSLASM